MMVRPTRSFPGTTFLFRGSALAHSWPWLLAIFAYSSLLLAFVGPIEEHGYTLTTTPFTLVGLALSIFLGFRNNACYDRWWEARKLWGQLVNTSRNFTRQALTWIDDPEIARELVLRTAAFPHVLRFHLRDQLGRMPRELAHLLEEEDITAMRREANVPNALLQGTSERVKKAWRTGRLDTLHVPMLDESLVRLHDIQGACERIKNTPVPLAYTILTHRIVGVYCIALPFGLMDTVGRLTPLVVLIVAFAFLGLDMVGSQIEDPFEEDPNDLPLTALSTMIEINVRQRLGDTDLPRPHQPVDGMLT